jgi:hypothetical protein
MRQNPRFDWGRFVDAATPSLGHETETTKLKELNVALVKEIVELRKLLLEQVSE